MKLNLTSLMLKTNNNLFCLLFVLITTIIFPPLILCFSIYFLLKRNYTLAFFLLALFLGWIAYCTIPYEGSDLAVHYNVMERLKNAPLNRIFYLGYQGVYLNNFIMWLISKIGNYALYQGILTFIGYYFLFKYILLSFLKNNLSLKYLIIVIFFAFIMSYFRTYVYATRNYFCFVVCIYQYYKLKEKQISPFFYFLMIIILSLIHPASLIFILFYFIDCLKKTKIVYFIFFLVLINQPILKLIALFFENRLFFLQKFFNYIVFFENVNINVLTLYILTIIFSLYIYNLLKIYKIPINNSYLLLIVLSISLLPNQELLKRFIYLLPFFSVEYLMLLFKKIDRYKLLTLYCFVVGLSIGVILYTYSAICAYGWSINYSQLLFPITSLNNI